MTNFNRKNKWIRITIQNQSFCNSGAAKIVLPICRVLKSFTPCLKVAFEAGKAGQQGQRQMRQALSLAKRYGVTPMPIHFAYLKALLTQTKGSLEPLHDLIAASYAQLATKPQVFPFLALSQEICNLEVVVKKQHKPALHWEQPIHWKIMKLCTNQHSRRNSK